MHDVLQCTTVLACNRNGVHSHDRLLNLDVRPNMCNASTSDTAAETPIVSTYIKGAACIHSNSTTAYGVQKELLSVQTELRHTVSRKGC